MFVCLYWTEEICLDHAMGQLCNIDLKPDETVDVQTKLGRAEDHDETVSLAEVPRIFWGFLSFVI